MGLAAAWFLTILPLRTSEGCDVRELSEYLHRLCRDAHVIVVDGSPPTVLDAHASLWGQIVTHVRPDPDLSYMNGKVNGVLTGFRLCLSEKVVIADEHVRYEAWQLHRIATLLDSAELVRPQNFFDPLPWHAHWDSARSLLNRALVGADFPGSLALRLTPKLRSGGYDGDVLFENLELIRTVQAQGGRDMSYWTCSHSPGWSRGPSAHGWQCCSGREAASDTQTGGSCEPHIRRASSKSRDRGGNSA